MLSGERVTEDEGALLFEGACFWQFALTEYVLLRPPKMRGMLCDNLLTILVVDLVPFGLKCCCGG